MLGNVLGLGDASLKKKNPCPQVTYILELHVLLQQPH